MAQHTSTPNRTCATCDKAVWNHKDAAKRAARRKSSNGSRLGAYWCPEANGWHIGHLPPFVIDGSRTRDDIRPAAWEGR